MVNLRWLWDTNMETFIGKQRERKSNLMKKGGEGGVTEINLKPVSAVETMKRG